MSITEPDIRELVFSATQRGIAGLSEDVEEGQGLSIKYIAFGNGKNGRAYEPHFTQQDLYDEFIRGDVINSVRLDFNTFAVDATLHGPQAGKINEIGAFYSNGDLAFVWSDPNGGLGTKNPGVPFYFSHTFVVDAFQLENVTFQAASPSVGNLNLIGPWAQICAEVIRAHRLGIEAEIQRVKPIISNMWR